MQRFVISFAVALGLIVGTLAPMTTITTTTTITIAGGRMVTTIVGLEPRAVAPGVVSPLRYHPGG
jgi:hypothetical protein